jgi:hypothetical protein
MAYMSQERKANLAPAIKALCKAHGVKASIAVDNHSTLVVNIKSSPFDFIGNVNRVMEAHPRYNNHTFRPATDSIQVNPYWCHEHFDGAERDFIVELVRLMNIGNHDNSDIQSDYFDVGWYISVNIGSWNKPYELVS